MHCPDENALAGYVDNNLVGTHRAAVERHLDGCRSCRAVVSDLARINAALPATAATLAARAPVKADSDEKTREIRGLRGPLSLPPGAAVGEYEIVGPLGQGGMGAVFAAIHPRIGKKVAIKVLSSELADDATAVARFENEARAVNAIGHPNIVDIFAFGELSGGRPYFVMEHVEGESLDQWMRSRGAISLVDAMPILKQIFDALAAAHEKGIAHRDLKPQNIMIAGGASAPRVKVLDFGLAKAYRAESPSLTGTGVVMGTPYYMSPEQCRGDVHVDHRTDVYALGVLIYQMLTGAYPFGGTASTEILAHHMLTEPKAPSAIAPSVPTTIDPIILKAMAKDPTVRYSTVRGLEAALDACLAATRTKPRSPRSWILGGAVACAAAAGAVVAAGYLGRSDPSTPDQLANSAAAPALAAAPDAPPAPPATPEVRANNPPLDPTTVLNESMKAVLSSFVVWSRDHAGAPCPDAAALGEVNDPWGHPIQITCTDQPADQIIGAMSAGIDGKMGTEDDVASWQLDREVFAIVNGPRWAASVPAPSAIAVVKREATVKRTRPKRTGGKRATTPKQRSTSNVPADGIPDRR